MTIVRTAIGVTPYAVTATAGAHTLILDEPASRGGQGAGFEPYEAVLAGLGACSAITLRMATCSTSLRPGRRVRSTI